MKKIYTYGIIDSNDIINKSIIGLEKAHVYNISYQDIGIVASDLDMDIQDVTKNHILRHEEIIEKLMGSFTILPMKFFTLFKTTKDILSMMKDYYGDFRKNLDVLHNKVEFGVKVIWSGDMVKERITKTYGEIIQNPIASNNRPVKNFLDKKFKEHTIEKKFAEEADKYIALVDDYFNKIAIEKKLQKLQSKNLLLNASYLVEKEKQNDFEEAFERLKNAQSSPKYLFSGPWPPYNFITMENKVSQWIK